MEEAKGGSSSGMTKLQTIVAEKNLPGRTDSSSLS